VTFFIRQVVRASGLPVLVDGDTGYGEALNVMNMVRSFEDAGAAAVHIEDQLLPKKCGHLNDKKLADARDMAAKVAAAAKARRHLYLIARTDAAASEGMDFARDVRGVRQARSRRSAAGEHDGVRQDAVLYRVRVRGDGLSHGDLAGGVAPRRQQGSAESVCRPQARRQHPQDARPDADARRTLRNDRAARLRGARRLHCQNHRPRRHAAEVNGSVIWKVEMEFIEK